MANFRKRSWALLVCFVLLLTLLPLPAGARGEKLLVPGGTLFGIRLSPGGLMVSAVKEVQSADGTRCPGRDAGLQAGDVLLTANGVLLNAASDLSHQVEKGRPVFLEGKRGEENFSATLTPVREKSGAYLAGIWVRQSASGIGTVTFYDPETGTFCGLGHGIVDGESGILFPVQSGTCHKARVENLIKGRAGVPGELRGALEKEAIGRVLFNSQTGITGTFDKPLPGEAIPYAKKDEIQTGKAVLLWAPDGEKRAYEVEIETICDPKGETKNMIVRITDPRLLSLSGGIVQGMSGSPLIQNGKLIGAVTHVLVHDPTRGYGIFLENMLRRK